MSGSVMVVAGEASGDLHVASVIRALRARAPDITCWGIAGEAAAAEGMELLYDTRRMAVMGFTEVVKRYSFFRRVFQEMLRLVEQRKPDVVVLVDYPGFNLRLAGRIHKRGVKVIYYICPQVWAWRRSRIHKMAWIVDRLLVIFPFEKQLFEPTGLQVDFVGHPLVDEAERVRSGPETVLPWTGETRVALLPGSRRQEIERMLPLLWRAAALLEAANPQACFLVAAPSTETVHIIEEQIRKQSVGPERYAVVAYQTRHVLRQATAAFVTSGTATIEAALMRCPTVVVYKTSLLTYWLGRLVVLVDHIGMVNIVAGRELCPELIQGEATPEALVEAITPLLTETEQRGAMLKGLEEVARTLGAGGAAERAAGIIWSELCSFLSDTM